MSIHSCVGRASEAKVECGNESVADGVDCSARDGAREEGKDGGAGEGVEIGTDKGVEVEIGNGVESGESGRFCLGEVSERPSRGDECAESASDRGLCGSSMDSSV